MDTFISHIHFLSPKDIMKSEEKLESIRKRILEELHQIIEEQLTFAEKESSSGLDFMNVTRDYILNNGKMLRGVLIVAAYEAVKGEINDEIYKAAASIEICQAYLLAHDDIADKAAIRRGEPSYHHRTVDLFGNRSSRLTKLSPDTNLNIGIATVGGDYLDALAQELLCSIELPSRMVLNAISSYSTTLRCTGYGQALDILIGVTPMRDVSEKDIKAIHKLKTASYTLIYPLLCGCYLADGTEEQIKGFTEFGEKVGIGFQIVDDILGSGLIEDESDKTKNDILEGKRTLLLLDTWRENEELRPVIDKLGKEEVSEEEVELVTNAMRETGVIVSSRQEAERLLEEGLKALNDISLHPDVKEFIEYVGHMLINRKK